MRCGLLGLGSIGRRHGRNLAALGVSSIGFDPDDTRRAQFTTEVPGARSVERAEDALRDVDFVVVASPSRHHLEQAHGAVTAGRNVFVEKPLAVSLDGIEELAAAIGERPVRFMMGSNWKFHPAVRAMQAAVAGGRIGRVLAVHAIGGQYLPDWHPWEDYRNMYSSRRALGGGALFDSHDIDYLSWMLGPVRRIGCFARTTGTLDIETEDLTALVLDFESGATGTLQIDYLQRYRTRRVHLTGESGTLIWDLAEGNVREFSAADKVWRVLWSDPGYDLNDMYLDEMRHFLAAIRTGIEIVTPLAQAIHVLRVLVAAHRSAEANGMPMEIA